MRAPGSRGQLHLVTEEAADSGQVVKDAGVKRHSENHFLASLKE